ncbi:MAG TPA: putative phage tail protein [Acidiferrobacterales bacterium]|nr:putative phage tail protein [Acidiferrobacterales bacterium]
MSLTRIAASWGADISSAGVKYPGDGGDWIGDSGAYRAANRWTLSGYSGALILGAWLEIEVLSIVGDVSLKTATVGPYNGDGLADPEADAGATAYTRSNVQADNYAAGITDLRTTGIKTIALGAQAVADIQAAIATGTFALAIQGDGEPWAAGVRSVLAEYTGTNKPTLILEYEPAAFAGTDYSDVAGTDRVASAGLGDAGSFVAIDEEQSIVVCNAAWSNDVSSTAFGSWTGHSIGPQTENLRTLITFDISGIAVGAPIGSVWPETTTPWVSGNAADSYYLGPYNGDGAANPQTDGAALAYTRADCSADNYLAGDTQYRTLGLHTWDLGAQAIADILAIRAAGGTLYTLALRQTLETGTQHYSTIEGWTMGAQAPKLRVYLDGGAGGGAVGPVWITQLSTDLSVIAGSAPPALEGAAYTALLQGLLPACPAWRREGNTVMGAVLEALAQEFARLDARAAQLFTETDPRLSYELLPDFERIAGLPDECTGALSTLEERRAALMARLARPGKATPQYFADVAGRLGYTVTIDEPALHTFRVHSDATAVREFTVNSPCTDPLRAWGDALLECIINRLKPAHTIVQFAYA